MQAALITTASVGGHYVIQNPLYSTKSNAQPVQTTNDKQDEQLVGHRLHWLDWIKYFSGHWFKHWLLYNMPVVHDRHVSDVFAHVLQGTLQVTQVLVK